MAKPGDKFGKWTIVRRLDGGGQGDVYTASGLEGEPEVAIKVVKLNRLKKRSRFVLEVSSQAKLFTVGAPNVMPVIDSNLAEVEAATASQGFIVMPLARATLESRLALTKGRIDLSLEIFAGVLRGIGSAHGNHVVHRDIKPANILFLDEGLRTPMVGDFGICLLRETPDSERLTADGETVGARYFMAPEQERGGVSDVTPAADIYALGKLLHHMLTGRLIYREETEGAFTPQELESDKRYQQILERIIHRTVVKDPGGRVGTIDELMEAILALMGGGSRPPVPPFERNQPVLSTTTENLAQEYEKIVRASVDPSSPPFLLYLDEMRRMFARSWAHEYETVKDKPQAAITSATGLIHSQVRPLALALAMGRTDVAKLFPAYKHFVEMLLREDKPRSGHPAVFGVPHLLAGFLYMSACVQALCYQSWEVLRLLVNDQFEWYYHSAEPRRSFGFALSYFFHSEALGRAADKTHDLFRRELAAEHLTSVLTVSDDELLNKYLQAQMLLCLRSAQEFERGNERSIWPDFGRFHDFRVRELIDRAAHNRSFGDGIGYVFGEDRDQFLSKIPSRIGFIRKNYWHGSRYVWSSIGE